MTGAEARRIRKDAGLSIYEMAALLRYRDVDGLRKMEAGSKPVTGPIQLCLEMIRDGKLDPEAELSVIPA